jgi:enoyl-[acyl-carrier protein] reductase II
MKIETAITRLLGIDLPIAQAGMSWASSCSALPLAVARAGGLGVIGAGPMRRDDLVRAIDEVRAGTDRPFAVNMPLYRQGADEILDLLVESRIPILIASQGGPKRYLDRFKAAGTVCLHVVAGVEHALKAADAGVDGLVVVGAEAGGHPPPELVSTLVVVRAVVGALKGRVPIIASGGFADGAGLAAALALGAGAANFGTRFIATPEASVHDAYKAAVLAALPTSTRAVGRGLGMIRTMTNDFAERMLTMEAEGEALETRKTVFGQSTLKMAALDGDMVQGKVEIGQSAGLVADLVPAGELVRRIAEEYLAARASLPASTS